MSSAAVVSYKHYEIIAAVVVLRGAGNASHDIASVHTLFKFWFLSSLGSGKRQNAALSVPGRENSPTISAVFISILEGSVFQIIDQRGIPGSYGEYIIDLYMKNKNKSYP